MKPKKRLRNGAAGDGVGPTGNPCGRTGTGSAHVSGHQGIAVDGSGTVYIADFGKRTIRSITSVGRVTKSAGIARCPGALRALLTFLTFRRSHRDGELFGFKNPAD